MNPSKEQYDELPGTLIERLAAQDRSVASITPRADAEVSRRAALHFAGRPATPGRVQHGRWGRVQRRRWAIPAALAASILLAILVVRPLDEFSDAPLLADDVDRSGRVDVLDAFALSRIRAADPTAVDPRDIERLMARIVSLGPVGGTR